MLGPSLVATGLAGGGDPWVMVNRAATSDLASALDLEAYSQGLAVAADDHQEGLAAFFDKRTPRFTGR